MLSLVMRLTQQVACVLWEQFSAALVLLQYVQQTVAGHATQI